MWTSKDRPHDHKHSASVGPGYVNEFVQSLRLDLMYEKSYRRFPFLVLSAVYKNYEVLLPFLRWAPNFGVASNGTVFRSFHLLFLR